MDLSSLSVSKLVFADTILSFALSPFATPPYNFPLFLFGTCVHDTTSNLDPFQLFTVMLGMSVLFDLGWMVYSEQSGLIKFLSILLFLLKIPTFFSSLLALRERGARFTFPASDGVWLMPGSLGHEQDYQVVGDQGPPRSSRPAPLTNVPGQAPAPPGAYQSV